jgi:GNAT superfamily N-acetyltransferase
MAIRYHELAPTPLRFVALLCGMWTSSRGIERGCFRIWETFPARPLRFCARKHGYHWSSGSIAATTSAGLQLRPINRRRLLGAGIQLQPILPRPIDISTIGEGRQGTIINVFTEPQWRRHGIAGLLIKEIVTWSKNERLDRLILHASGQGRPIYEKLGFIASNEMRLSGDQ